MLKNESNIWKFLNKFNISKFSFDIQEKDTKSDRYAEFINGKFVEVEPKTLEKGTISFCLNGNIQNYLIYSEFFANFTTNINRAIAFYPEIIKLNNPEEFFNMKNISNFQTIHILLITALEVYLDDLFRWISKDILIGNIEPELLDKFLKNFNLIDKYQKIYNKKGNQNFTLSEILPKRMDFQQKRKCKIAYNLLGIDVVNIRDSIWEKIYGRYGYIKERNAFIHSDMHYYIHHYLGIKKNIDFHLDDEIKHIENVVIDIVKFAYYIEHQRFFKYPNQAEINTGLLDNFNYKELNPLVKEIVVNQNLNDFFYFADYKFNEGDYDRAIEVYEVISQVRQDIVEVWYKLGLTFEKKNISEKALELYRKAYRLNPSYKDLKQKLEINENKHL